MPKFVRIIFKTSDGAEVPVNHPMPDDWVGEIGDTIHVSIGDMEGNWVTQEVRVEHIGTEWLKPVCS